MFEVSIPTIFKIFLKFNEDHIGIGNMGSSKISRISFHRNTKTSLKKVEKDDEKHTSLKNVEKDDEKRTFLKNVVKDDEKHKSRYILPQKQFHVRESPLIQYFKENRSIRAVYNICIACYFLFIITFTLKEFIHQHRLPKALNVIYRCFGKLHYVALIWIVNNLTTCLTYFCFLLWGRTRQKVESKVIWDTFWIFMLIGYYALSFFATTAVINRLNIPFASAVIVTVESVRFLLKIYAFVRENVPKILLLRSPSDEIQLPTFSTFVYFLYSPTVVYRDNYPRSEKIRYTFIALRILEIFAIIIFLAYWYEYVVRPFFKETCMQPMSLIEIFLIFLEFALPSVLLLWSMFFLLIHSSQNAVAEALRFGDRMFYSDWWNCTDVQQYYRKWNLVIGDWLYTYIHKDMYEKVCPGKRNLARCVTIILSAVVHEWICTVATGYFIPILTTAMLFSAAMCVSLAIDKNSHVGNIFALIAIILGASYMVTFYALEHFARLNSPTKQKFISIFWTENCVSF